MVEVPIQFGADFLRTLIIESVYTDANQTARVWSDARSEPASGSE